MRPVTVRHVSGRRQCIDKQSGPWLLGGRRLLLSTSSLEFLVDGVDKASAGVS